MNNEMREIIQKELKQYHKKWYLYLIDEISHNADMNFAYGELLVKELLELYKAKPETDWKAKCIESAIRVIDDLADDNCFTNDQVRDLYELYVQLLKDGYNNVEKISETLTLFLDLNIETDEVIENLVAIMDEYKSIKVLSGITSDALWQCEKHKALLKKVSLHKKKCSRFDLVLHFFLLTNPSYLSNIEIVGDYLKKYYNYSVVLADWIFFSETPNEKYVKAGIISKREQIIFIRAGDVVKQYREEMGSELSFDEVMLKLDETSRKFQNELLKNKMKMLYNEFFDGRDFLEAACSLPVCR